MGSEIGHLALSFPGRLLGALRLDASAYEEIDRDRDAMPQAVAVVALVALAVGVSAMRENGWAGLIVGVIIAVAGWLIYSGLVYVVGTGIMPDERTESEATFDGLLRAMGFAQAPDALVIFTLLGGILGPLLGLVGSVWAVLCMLVALRASLRLSTGRAIVVAVIAVIPTLLFGAFVLGLTGPG